MAQQQAAHNTQKPLVEFKAGKMNFAGKTVSPDKRKGLVQLVQSADGLIHFQWKDRNSGSVEDDLIIFPEDATFKRLKQCSSARVFLLEFKSDRKVFFWMQEAKEDKDDELATKVNQYINNPPTPEQQGTSRGMPSGLDQNAFMQMFQPRPGAQSPTSQVPSGIQINQLQNILSGIGLPLSTVASVARQDPQTHPAQTPSSVQPGQQSRGTNLSQVMSPDMLMPLLNNPEIQQQLMQYLPEENRSPQELIALLRSPQYQQALEAFNSALQSGQLTELLRQFGVGPSTGGSGVDQFLQALLQAQPQQQSTTEKTDKVDEKQDDKKDDKNKRDDKKDDGSMDTS